MQVLKTLDEIEASAKYADQNCYDLQGFPADVVNLVEALRVAIKALDHYDGDDWAASKVARETVAYINGIFAKYSK